MCVHISSVTGPQFVSRVKQLISIGCLFYVGFACRSYGKESACNAGDWVHSLGGKDTLEKGMATHSSILAWRIPWTEECAGLPSMGLQRVKPD